MIRIEGLKKVDDKIRFDLKRVLEDWARHDLEEQVQKNLAGRFLKRRTGHLARSTLFRMVVHKGSDGYEVLFTTAKYGPIHEHGGTIRPKRAKYLTIPLKANKTPAGAARYSAPEIPDLFPLVVKGKLFLVRNEGKKGLVFYFLLKKKVRIPARRWFSSAIAKKIGALNRRLKEEVEKTLKAIFTGW